MCAYFVVAAWMPFQTKTSFPVVSDAKWFKLGVINNSSSACFIYSNITYVNVDPAIYAVCAGVYAGQPYTNFKLIAGKSGGSDYQNNIKYKFENGTLHFWVKGSSYSSSTLIVLTGKFSIDGTIENPPSNATQPSF